MVSAGKSRTHFIMMGAQYPISFLLGDIIIATNKVLSKPPASTYLYARSIYIYLSQDLSTKTWNKDSLRLLHILFYTFEYIQ